jgi:hypothetical protein
MRSVVRIALPIAAAGAAAYLAINVSKWFWLIAIFVLLVSGFL